MSIDPKKHLEEYPASTLDYGTLRNLRMIAQIRLDKDTEIRNSLVDAAHVELWDQSVGQDAKDNTSVIRAIDRELAARAAGEIATNGATVKLSTWGADMFAVRVAVSGQLLRRGFNSVEQAVEWARTTDFQKLRLFYVPAEVKWGEDWSTDKGMRRIYGLDPADVVAWATTHMGMDITERNVFEGVIA